MNFTAKDVADLRAKTGCGMMDCKKALTEAEGDVEKATEILREKGLALLTYTAAAESAFSFVLRPRTFRQKFSTSAARTSQCRLPL